MLLSWEMMTMARLTQGADFNEAPIVGVDGNPVNSSGDGGSTPPPNAPKMGPKQIALFAGIGVLAIIIIIVMMSRGGGTTSSSSSSSSISSSEDDEWIVNPNPDPNWGKESASTVDTESKPTGGGDPVDDPFTFCFYSSDEVSSLRGYGYTGDEIEYHSQNQTPYDTLVQKAEEAYDNKYKEWRQSILDAASPEYKELVDKTFLGSGETPSTCEASEVVNYGTHTENVDYEKCGVYNYQAWIKVHTSIGDLMMSPELTRYTELEDSGNIVIVYNYAVNKDGDMLYVTSIKEKSIR